MNYKVIIEPDILAQLFSVSLFYDAQKIGLGAVLEGDVLETLDTIAENPEIYPIDYRDVHRALVKRFHLHIYYVIASGTVLVVEFRDARREPPKYHG